MIKTSIDENDVEKLCDVIENNDVFVLRSKTGSGKSTFLIKSLYNRGYKTFILGPTIIAVQAVYNFMQQQLGENNIGFAYDSKINYKNKILNNLRNPALIGPIDDSDTSVVYCTSGHITQRFFDLIKCSKTINDLKFCDILFIDEAHNGSLDYSIIMTLWKYLYDKGIKLPKLFLVSATIDVKATIFPNAPVFEVKIDSYPIDIIYNTKDYLPDSDDIYTDLANVIIKYHKSKETYLKSGEIWLVFCPGEAEINKTLSLLLKEGDDSLIPVSLYSSQLSRSEDIFNLPDIGKRKIIISTNIAEASITINNLSGVFDTLVEKNIESSLSGGEKLQITNISKSSATQRSGRTGRTCKGFAYRMCTEQYFKALPEQRIAEINRIPLHSMIIKLLNIGLDPKSIFDKSILHRIIESEKILLKLKMITLNPIEVTHLGKFATKFTLSLYSSAFLYNWYYTTHPLFIGICICALVDGFNRSQLYFYYPKKEFNQNTKTYEKLIRSYYNTYDGDSDLEVLLNMLNDLFIYIDYNINNTSKIIEYNIANKLNNKKILEVISNIKKISQNFKDNKVDVSTLEFNTKDIVKKATLIYKNILYDRIYHFKVKTNTLIYTDGKLEYILDKRLPLSSNTKEEKTIIGILTTEIQSKLTEPPKRYISLAIPLF